MTNEALAAAERADLTLSQAAGEYRGTPLVRVLGTLSEVADQPQMVTINLLTVAAGAVRGDRRLLRTGVHMLAAHGLATLAKSAIKRSVDRTRPKLLVDEGRYDRGAGEHNEGPYNSFPSGHTAGAVAVARAVARRHEEAALPLYVAATAIALIQIPRCAHFVSDIGAGALIGAASEAVSHRIVERVLPE